MYFTYSDYLKNKFGEKVYKLPISLPITCPNRRNGEGCTFCADVGTAFEACENNLSVLEQLEITKAHIQNKYNVKKFIAYFQNYTNTYMPLKDFKEYISEATLCSNLVGISISTRPDCIKTEYLEYLKEVSTNYQLDINFELGLQTANYKVLDEISRGHGLAEYIDSVLMIQKYGFSVCTHVILNLPNITQRDVVETAKIISALKTDIVKIHSLYIAKDTPMAKQYLNGEIKICDKETYFNWLMLFLEFLNPDIAVERLFSRIPEEHSVFSNWNTSWWKLKDEFIQYMNDNNSYQGKQYHYLNGSAFYEEG